MSELSGLVVILDEQQTVVEVRDLGPSPVPVKPGLAFPLADVRPELGANQKYGVPEIAVGDDSATRTWPVLDMTPADFPLSMRQLRLGLLGAGKPVGFIQDVIDGIADVTQRAYAQIWYEETSVVEWDHAQTQALIALSGLSSEEASAMWLAAKDIAA